MTPQVHCKFDEMLVLSSFRPHPKNRNKHPQEQVDQLANLYQAHGIRHPIIVSKRSGYVVVGHCRLQAAKKAGLIKFPVVYQDFETEAQEYEFLNADNGIALWADFNIGEIKLDIQGIEGINIDNLAIPGLSDVKSHARLKDEEKPKEEPKEEKPTPEASPCYIKAGDIWLLQNHELTVSPNEEDLLDAQSLIEHYGASRNSDRIFLLDGDNEIPLKEIKAKRLNEK